MWRCARGEAQRRSLALRVRWKLRKLAGSRWYAEACRLVEESAKGVRRCGECGRVMRQRTRLVSQYPSGFPGK